MLAKGGRAKSKADAVWHSNKGEAERGRRRRPARRARETRRRPAQSQRERRQTAEPKHIRGHIPAFIAPQLAKLVDRPPNGDGWGHELKLDGYRLLLRVENGKATLKTRKGLDWTTKFPEIADTAKSLPDCMLDGEVCALNDQRRAELLGAAGSAVR